jgi:rhodanese-related sulfurtransferase
MIKLLLSALLASFLTWYLVKPKPVTNNDRIADFYSTENAVHVSPHTVRKKMDKGETDFVLVDLRSSQEYEKEHVVGAVNIPAYKDPNTSISVDTDKDQANQIIRQFGELPKERDIIVYCYSTPCMTGRKIGKLLADNGIFVKHLNIGWNEWRYSWDLWNHDGETPTKGADYIVTGKDPGKPKAKDTVSPCTIGELGC